MSVHANPSEIATLAPNIAVFVVAVIAAVAGVYQGLRNLKKESPPPTPGTSTFTAGAILDNVSMTLWSESNRTAAEAARDVVQSNTSLKASNYAVRDEIKELCHQIERLRDVMERKR